MKSFFINGAMMAFCMTAFANTTIIPVETDATALVYSVADNGRV